MEPRGVSLASRVHARPRFCATPRTSAARGTMRTTRRRPRADGKSRDAWPCVRRGSRRGRLRGGRERARRDGGVARRHLLRGRGLSASLQYSDGSDVDAEGIETELTAAVPPSCKTFDASSKNDHAGVTAPRDGRGLGVPEPASRSPRLVARVPPRAASSAGREPQRVDESAVRAGPLRQPRVAGLLEQSDKKTAPVARAVSTPRDARRVSQPTETAGGLDVHSSQTKAAGV